MSPRRSRLRDRRVETGDHGDSFRFRFDRTAADDGATAAVRRDGDPGCPYLGCPDPESPDQGCPDPGCPDPGGRRIADQRCRTPAGCRGRNDRFSVTDKSTGLRRRGFAPGDDRAANDGPGSPQSAAARWKNQVSGGSRHCAESWNSGIVDVASFRGLGYGARMTRDGGSRRRSGGQQEHYISTLRNRHGTVRPWHRRSNSESSKDRTWCSVHTVGYLNHCT